MTTLSLGVLTGFVLLGIFLLSLAAYRLRSFSRSRLEEQCEEADRPGALARNEGLKFVFEIQSRLEEWRKQAEEDRRLEEQKQPQQLQEQRKKS